MVVLLVEEPISLLLQVKSTLQYVPGRKYDVKVSKKVRYLREERVDGRPQSFKKLDEWLIDRRLELADFLRATSVVVQEQLGEEGDVDTDVDGEEEQPGLGNEGDVETDVDDEEEELGHESELSEDGGLSDGELDSE